MNVLVTGGTGTLGRQVVRQLEATGDQVLALSRRGPVMLDLATGAGLESALRGVETVVHCATDPFGKDPRRVEVEGTARLVRAAAGEGVSHVVYVSIVGVDRVPYPYYRYKLAAERVVEAGPVPWSILRATQFHPFVAWLLTRLPVLLAPRGFVLQPVAVQEVASRLVRAVREGAAGRLRDFGGPQVREASDLARALRRARHLRRPVLRPWLPGPFAAAVRAGGLICPEGEHGALTWEQWLAGSRT